MIKTIRGYIEGFQSESINLPEQYQAESVAFKHSWLNGRDDRLGWPRTLYKDLKQTADLISSICL